MIIRAHGSLAIRLASIWAKGALRIAIAILIIALVCAGCLLAIWVGDLRATAQQPQNDCAFESVAVERYRALLDQARKQGWSIWPDLSNGLFWPSDRGPFPPSAAANARAASRLGDYIRDLAPKAASANEQLAAVHAVMQSIGAEYSATFKVPDFPREGQPLTEAIYVDYLLPQRLFAPLCLSCFFWPDTTLSIAFRGGPAAKQLALERVVVLHGGPKFAPNRESQPGTACPPPFEQ